MHPDDPESYPSDSPFFWVFFPHSDLKKNLVGGIAPQSKNAILISVDAP
jgi:hypothetical protein